MLFLKLLILLVILDPFVYSNVLNFNKFCWPSYYSIDNLIKDVEVTNRSRYQIDSIRKNCYLRYGFIELNIPNQVAIVKHGSKWIASFTFFNYSSPIEKSDETFDLISNYTFPLWITYLIIPGAFSCYRCRVSLSLSFGHVNQSTQYQIRYGFIRTTFPLFIDYTSKETMRREDKSKYQKINLNLTNQNDSLNTFFLDDKFFGDSNQYMLLEVSQLLSVDQPKYHLLNFTSPSVVYHVCYAYTYGRYIPDSTCYPYVSDQSKPECICWKIYQLKQIIMMSVIISTLVISLLLLLYRHYKPKKVNEVNIVKSDKIQSSKSQDTTMIYFTKILIRLDAIEKHRLPGKLEISLKGTNGVTLMDIAITCGQTFSANYLATNDVNELLVIVQTKDLIEKPTLVEVTYFKELDNKKAEKIYLYGLTIETNLFTAIFPYSHYLKSHRQVMLSNQEAWNQAIHQNPSVTRFPITLPFVQSLTFFERYLMMIYGFSIICSDIQTLLVDEQDNILLILLEGVASTLFAFSIIFIIYVRMVKKLASYKYFMIPLFATGHKVFELLVIIICSFLGERLLSSVIQLGQSIWPIRKFNHQIASIYSIISWKNDIRWLVISFLSFIIYLICSFIIETTFFKLYNFKAFGPIAFDLVG